MNDYLVLYEKNNKGYAVNHDGNVVTINEKPIFYLARLCMKHGSTFEGRIDACKKSLNIKQKAPLLISELTNEIWFPTLSSTNKDNIWINYNEIIDITSLNNNESLITFKNGYKYKISINIRIIRKQIQRCKEYIELLNNI